MCTYEKNSEVSLQSHSNDYLSLISPDYQADKLNRKKVPIAILASGEGSNFEAIVKARESGLLDVSIKLLITPSKNLS